MILQLYKDCKIKKNDVIEKTYNYDILTYLGTLESETVVNLNLNKRIFSDLTVSIKINRKLREIDVYSYNYAMIQEGDERYFYFIADKQWVADSTTRLILLMDTCNTFEYKNRIISDTSKYKRCNVIREHRDRFTSNNLPIIDKIDEGFGTIPMEIKETKLLGNDDKYYLGYYQSPGANVRSVCKVFKDEGEDHTRIWYNLSTKILKNYFTAPGQVLIAYSDRNHTFFNKNSKPNDPSSTDFWDNKNINLIYITHPAVDSYLISIGGYWMTSNMIHFSEKEIEIGDSELDYYSDQPFTILLGNNLTTGSVADKTFYLSDLLGPNYTKTKSTVTYGLNFIIPSFKDNLKSDSDILKIVEIPYFNEGNLFPYYDYDTGTVVAAISDISTYTMSFGSEDFYKTTLPASLDNQLADKKYETKLLGSQFTNNMFKYDSFSYSLAAEDLTIPQTSFNINVRTPIDMSTTVAYEFDYKGTTHNEFDRWLITQRNNQIPTMTNKYLEYMQNGYNYDVKNRNIQTGLSWANFAIQAPLTAFSMGGGISNLLTNKGLMSQANNNDWFKKIMSKVGWGSEEINNELLNQGSNPNLNKSDIQTSSQLAIQNIYNSSSGLISGLTNNIVSTIQSQEAIDKRKKDYLRSSENISNSDDVTLFNIYNGGNKLRYSKYQPREDIVNNVSNILRFTGYATNQEKTPDLNTRWYYNYLQADIEYEGGDYIPISMLEDIKNSVGSGITLFHYKKGKGYDLDKKYENWENAISGGSPSPEPTPTPGEITDLEVTGETVLRDDGYFYYVSYQITNPNNFDVLFTGIFREDEKTILTDFSLKAGETIGDKLEVDGKNLTLVGNLSKKEN